MNQILKSAGAVLDTETLVIYPLLRDGVYPYEFDADQPVQLHEAMANEEFTERLSAKDEKEIMAVINRAVECMRREANLLWLSYMKWDRLSKNTRNTVQANDWRYDAEQCLMEFREVNEFTLPYLDAVGITEV